MDMHGTLEMQDTRPPSVSVNLKGMRTLNNVPKIGTLKEIQEEEEEVGPGTKMVTVFAATMSDFSNCNVNYQKLVDFMAKLRDHNIDCREEVDGYLRKYNLQPSKKYLEERITPNIPEIEDAIHEYKIAKNFSLNQDSRLSFDFKKKGKYCVNFFQACRSYHMPKVHALNFYAVDKLTANNFMHFAEFVKNT